jgi:hypothetical protein
MPARFRLSLLAATCFLVQPAFAQDCDRDCLRSITTRYLDAMVRHDPARAPLAENVRFTEDSVELPIGEGLRVGSFVTSDAPFGAGAYRFENGQLMAGPDCTFFAGCDNIREQRLPTLAGITARVAAVDEEQGIVWLRMNFGPGSVMRAEGELSVWEMFKIYDDRIQAVEAYMEIVPAGTPSGWD